MDSYSKFFFVVFLVLGALWGVFHQSAINDFTTMMQDSFLALYQGYSLSTGLDSILAELVILVLRLILGLIYLILYLLILVASLFHGQYILLGMFLFYPLYVIYINLFEMFVLLLIKHPSRDDIRRLIRKRDIENVSPSDITKAMISVLGKKPPALASNVLNKKAKKLTRIVQADTIMIRKLREKKIRQALRELGEI